MGKLIRNLLCALMLIPLLAGCAFSDPRIEGTPPLPTTDPSQVAEMGTAADLIKQAWSDVAGVAALDTGQPVWTSLASTLEAQWLVLVGPDPYNRFSDNHADIGSPATVASVDDGISAATTALIAARDHYVNQADGSSGVAAVFWASLAAGVEQVRQGLGGSYGTVTPANTTVSVASETEAQALADLISRYDEGIFALRAAIGFLDPSDTSVDTYRSILSTLQRDQVNLEDLASSRSIALPTSQGIYELPSGRDQAAAAALLTRTQQELVEASAVWVASTSDPTTATTYLMSNATLAGPLGIGMAQWPGWPDA